MNILIDTNVILDWVLNRSPFYAESAAVVNDCLNNTINGFLTSHTLSDIFYITRKHLDAESRMKLIHLLASSFFVIPENADIIISVCEDKRFNDLEDGLNITVAELLSLDLIITRDINDYACSEIQVISPAEYSDN